MTGLGLWSARLMSVGTNFEFHALAKAAVSRGLVGGCVFYPASICNLGKLLKIHVSLDSELI